MKRRPKQVLQEENPALVASDGDQLVQIKVWLLGVSPMVWRRVLVPADCTLRELHGVFQVAMGWEGIHLYQFRLRAARYGSWELSASSPDVSLVALQLRKGARFVYEYDLNTPWRHEVRIEARPPSTPGKTYPPVQAETAPVRPRTVADQPASWTAATVCCRSMPLMIWIQWSRSSARLPWSADRKSSTMMRRDGG